MTDDNLSGPSCSQRETPGESQTNTALSVDGIFWTRSSTLLLIQEIGKKLPAVNSGKMKKKDMFNQVATEMNKMNVSCTVDNVGNKWKTLLRGFKAVKDHNRKTGVQKKTHPFENELDAILAKDPNVSPTHTSSSSSKPPEKDEGMPSCSSTKKRKIETSGIELDENTNENKNGESTDSSPNGCKKLQKSKQSSSSQLVSMLGNYMGKQEERNENIAQRMQTMHNEKMDLLKSLIDIMKK